MRLRYAETALARLQATLDKTGHPPGDPYRAAKITEFWQKVRSDYQIAKREL